MKKIILFVIAFSLLFNGVLVVVGGGAVGESVSEKIENTEFEATEIHDWYDLNQVRDVLDKDYILMSDLDEKTEGYDELVDTENGWEPIGEYDREEDLEFNGTFDGDGHEIRDLYIDRSGTNEVGLFGYNDEEGTILNIGVIEADVNGERSVSPLVGENHGKVENSYATGEVSGYRSVGGLVGSNRGSVNNSYATGEVSGEEKFAGGLMGTNSGTVNNSYATGDVSGSDFVGGLIGENYDGEVSNAYATGKVSGPWHHIGLRPWVRVGGFVGRNLLGPISNSYWDIETSGQDDSADGTGLTTDELTGENAPYNMDGFDFDEIWETIEEDHEDAEEDGYPILQESCREEQLQHVYPVDPVEDDWIPGFNPILLLMGVVIAVAIYKKKER